MQCYCDGDDTPCPQPASCIHFRSRESQRCYGFAETCPPEEDDLGFLLDGEDPVNPLEAMDPSRGQVIEIPPVWWRNSDSKREGLLLEIVQIEPVHAGESSRN